MSLKQFFTGEILLLWLARVILDSFNCICTDSLIFWINSPLSWLNFSLRAPLIYITWVLIWGPLLGGLRFLLSSGVSLDFHPCLLLQENSFVYVLSSEFCGCCQFSLKFPLSDYWSDLLFYTDLVCSCGATVISFSNYPWGPLDVFLWTSKYRYTDFLCFHTWKKYSYTIILGFTASMVPLAFWSYWENRDRWFGWGWSWDWGLLYVVGW